MARRRRYVARRRRSGGGGTLIMALGMLAIFAAVVFWQNTGRQPGTPAPLPTSALTPVSDTVRLEAQDYYAIQFGAYENAQSAAQKAEEYVGRGAAGYVWQEKDAYRVLAAVYDSLADAQTIKDRLASQGIEAYIYTIRQDALEMRVAAGESQRALIARVFAFIPRVHREFGEVSVALDQNTMTAQEATERMRQLYGQAKLLLEELQAGVPNDKAGIIQAVCTLLSQIMTNCANIFSQNLQETLAISAKVKYNYLDVLWNAGNFVQQVLRTTGV